MLLQTNSYIVSRDKREQHERLIRRIRQALLRVGCEQFDVYEEVGANWAALKGDARFIQVMHFRDRHHHQQIQEAEKTDPAVQQLIKQFMELVDLPQQQAEGIFSMSYFSQLGGATVEAGPAPITRQPAPGEDAGPARHIEPEHTDDGSGNNNKPARHGGIDIQPPDRSTNAAEF